MTNEEAIKILSFMTIYSRNMGRQGEVEALELAIKALEEQSNIHDKCKKCVEFSEYQPNDDWEEYSDKLWKEAYERGKAEALEEQTSEDCISRAEALAVVEKEKQGWEGSERYAIDECHSRIMELPSVTPSKEALKEAYINGYDYGVKEWFKAKTKPCEDAVSRQMILDKFAECCDHIRPYSEVWEFVRNLPSVTPQDEYNRGYSDAMYDIGYRGQRNDRQQFNKPGGI